MLQITIAMPSRRPGHRRPARRRHGEPATLGPNTRNHRALPSRADRGRERQHQLNRSRRPWFRATRQPPAISLFSEDRERSNA